MTQVKAFASTFVASNPRLNVLVNNAGGMPSERTLSAQGNEAIMVRNVQRQERVCVMHYSGDLVSTREDHYSSMPPVRAERYRSSIWFRECSHEGDVPRHLRSWSISVAGDIFIRWLRSKDCSVHSLPLPTCVYVYFHTHTRELAQPRAISSGSPPLPTTPGGGDANQE